MPRLHLVVDLSFDELDATLDELHQAQEDFQASREDRDLPRADRRHFKDAGMGFAILGDAIHAAALRASDKV